MKTNYRFAANRELTNVCFWLELFEIMKSLQFLSRNLINQGNINRHTTIGPCHKPDCAHHSKPEGSEEMEMIESDIRSKSKFQNKVSIGMHLRG